MRLNEKNAESLAVENFNEASEMDLMEALKDHRSYHELSDTPIVEVDSLTQLRTNLEVLSDLTARLSFLNREIRYVMKVD